MDISLQCQFFRKIFNIVALVSVCCFWSFTLCAAVGSEAFTQSRRVTLNITKRPIDYILGEINRQAGVDFLLRGGTETERQLSNLSVKVNNVSVEDALDELLAGTNFTYTLDDNTVIILRRQTQQSRRMVVGRVTDVEGRAIPGASVTVIGTSVGAVSDARGNFMINVRQGGVLRITHVGMKSVDVTYSGQDIIEVVLEDDVADAGNVVITGIFNKAKESYTGAATLITQEQLKAAGNRSILTAIRNIDPSFNISDNINIGSDPNKLPTITIRGSSSLPTDIKDMQTAAENMRAANQPLIIVDGFEITLQRFMDMDDNMVENVTLLKDASATAMYGTRGSNGVVVITTKRPEAGRLRFSYTGSMNIEAPDLTSYNLMNAREKLRFEYAAGLYDYEGNDENDQFYKDMYNRRLLNAERGVDTYWLGYPVRTGIGSRHSMGLDGGDETFRYQINLSYNNIAGTMKGSSRNTMNGGIYTMYTLRKLTFMNDLQVSLGASDNSPYGSFSLFARQNPYFAPYDDGGNLLKNLDEYIDPESGQSKRAPNPLWDARQPGKDESRSLQLYENFAIEWSITPYLFVRGQFALSTQRSRSDKYIAATNTMFDSWVGGDFARKGRYTYGSNYSDSAEAMLTLNYSRTFAERHQLFAGLAANAAQQVDEGYTVVGEGITMLDMDYLGAAMRYQQNGRPGDSESIVRNAGVMLNVNYTYDNRYIVDMSAKSEGSSQFGANRRMAPFWSAGAGWNIHRERFMEGNNVLNYARLRLSYGITGSQEFPAYLANSSYRDFGGLSYQNWYGAYLIALGNRDLAWQKTRQWNLGTELQFLNNRFGVTLDVYRKMTHDLLADVNIPTSSGYENYKANVGKMENSGLELMVNAFVLRNSERNFSWAIGGSMVHNKNTIREISNSLKKMNEDLMAEGNKDENKFNPSLLYQEGRSVNTIYAVRSKGIDPGNGREIYIKADGSETYDWNPRDQVACGTTDPKLNGTFNTTVRWRSFTLNAYFYYRFGGQAYNHALAGKVENLDPAHNADRRALYDRWQKPGDRSLYKSVRDRSETRPTSRFVMDDNSVSFSSVRLAYDVPAAWAKKNLGMQYLQVQGSMEDVFHSSTIKRERGLSYPFSRKFSLSLTARF